MVILIRFSLVLHLLEYINNGSHPLVSIWLSQFTLLIFLTLPQKLKFIQYTIKFQTKDGIVLVLTRAFTFTVLLRTFLSFNLFKEFTFMFPDLTSTQSDQILFSPTTYRHSYFLVNNAYLSILLSILPLLHY